MYKYWYINILLIWEPWSGKTTLLKQLICGIDKKVWMLTEQILNEAWERVWFELVDHVWNRCLLASKEHKSFILFANKYRIHTEGLQRLMKDFSYKRWDLIYVDEIAPMELYAQGFEKFVQWLLESPNPLIGIIKLDDDNYNFVKEIKKRSDILILNISDQNFDKEFLQTFMKKVKKSQKYLQEPERYEKISESNYIMHSESTTRNIIIKWWVLRCDCQFYQKYGTCSHIMALRQIVAKN